MLSNPLFEPLTARLKFAGGVVLVCALLLVWRWSYLQVDKFSHFTELAHENQIKLLPLEPPRGFIYDRSGRRLADNNTIYSLHVVSDFAADVLEKVELLTAVVHVPQSAMKKLREAADSKVYKGDIVLREKLSEEEVADFIGWQFKFPEIVFRAGLARHYPFQDQAGHVLGFVGRINPQEVERLKKEKKYPRYRGAVFIGKTGVELLNEDALRGKLGSQEAQVDAHGRILKSRILRQAERGEDVYLTLDWELQRLAEELLAGERGAAVMMDVHSGALLVLASSPRFDVNAFVFGVSHDEWDALNQSAEKPLIHRAIYGQYAPGSTIKPFLALASLQRGWRDLSYTYFSDGTFQLTPKHVFHDWKEGGHGEVDVVKSLVRSVNTYYYELGNEVGIEKLHSALAEFGFGDSTRLDLDNEKPGVLPSPQWKKAQVGEIWYPGDTVATSVGQGYMQVTPLQITRAMAMLANGGRRVQPYLVKPSGAVPPQMTLTAKYLRTVQEALAAVTRIGGTAPFISSGAKYHIAGKTGTAQVSRLQLDEDGKRIKNEDLPKHLRDHAWFVGYAPAEAPQVAVAVLVENSGSGNEFAAPVVRRLLDSYMQSELQEKAGAAAGDSAAAGETAEAAGAGG